MSDDLRWAARYAFVRELWSGRARVVLDARLEALLVGGGPDAGKLGGPLVELIDELVPRHRSDPVWVVVRGATTAAELAAQRPGTSFVDIAALPGVLRSRPWEVALVDLAPLLELEGERAELRASALLSDIGSMLDGRRVAIVSAPSRPSGSAIGLGYSEISAWVGRELGGGRLWGSFGPRVAGFVEYGEPIEAMPEVDVTSPWDVRTAAGSIGSRRADANDDEVDDPDEANDLGDLDDEALDDEALDDEALDDTDADDTPVQFDNTLGGEEPAIDEWLVISGGQAEPGLTLVELPGDDDLAATMRLQLAQARRQIDLAALERQTLIEQVDAAHAHTAELDAELEQLRDRLARAQPGEPLEADSGSDRESMLAREQALRWRVRQLEQELDALRQASPTELEAELESLRARAAAEPTTAAAAAPDVDAVALRDEVEALRARLAEATAVGAHGAPEDDGDSDSARRGPASTATYAVLRAVDGLVRRIERGGIGALELRRELEALRRRLRPQWTE